MKDKDIRLPHLIEADLAKVNKALYALSKVSTYAYDASTALQLTRHKLRQELMQAYFDVYAQGIELDGTIILNPKYRSK